MTRDEALEKINAIAEKAEKDKNEILREYAFLNSPYKIGDIVEYGDKKIIIDNIKWIYHYQLSSCVYDGFLLKKDNSLRKDKTRASIWQRNVSNCE
jgi:hypothetical protein